MWLRNRRDFFRFAALAAGSGGVARWAAAADASKAEIYRLLGFATMTGPYLFYLMQADRQGVDAARTEARVVSHSSRI